MQFEEVRNRSNNVTKEDSSAALIVALQAGASKILKTISSSKKGNMKVDLKISSRLLTYVIKRTGIDIGTSPLL